MTDDQMQQLREFAQNKIEENMAKTRLKIGSGLQVRQNDRETLLFMDGAHRFRGPSAQESVWSVTIYGFTVSHSQGQHQPEEGDTIRWDNTITTEPQSLVSASSNEFFRFRTSIVDRLAYYRTSDTGFEIYDQTLYLSVPSYQFPVQLTLRVETNPVGPGPPEVSEEAIEFFSSQEYPYFIGQFPTEGFRRVTAISLTRL